MFCLRNLRTTHCRSLQISTRNVSKKKAPKVDKKLQAQAECLAARGFLRPNLPYDPPKNILEIVSKVCASHGLNEKSKLESLDVKFKILNSCYEETGHCVPNSLIHTIGSIVELKEFYLTPVETSSPFETLLNSELPKNLNIQKDYVRFHPDKDTLFNGVSALPKSSTIVTGLKARKKYEGFEAKRSWP